MPKLRLHTFLITASASLWVELSPSAFAAETQPSSQGLSAGNGLATTMSLATSIGKIIGALALIVFLMMLLIYFIKKSGLDLRGKKKGSLIQVVETRMIAPKKYISIIEIAGKYVSVGVTDHNINLLTEIPDSAACRKAAEHQTIVTPFSGVLKKSIASFKAAKGKDYKQDTSK